MWAYPPVYDTARDLTKYNYIYYLTFPLTKKIIFNLPIPVSPTHCSTCIRDLKGFPIMLHKIIPFVDYNKWSKRLDTQLNETTN